MSESHKPRAQELLENAIDGYLDDSAHDGRYAKLSVREHLLNFAEHLLNFTGLVEIEKHKVKAANHEAKAGELLPCNSTCHPGVGVPYILHSRECPIESTHDVAKAISQDHKTKARELLPCHGDDDCGDDVHVTYCPASCRPTVATALAAAEAKGAENHGPCHGPDECSAGELERINRELCAQIADMCLQLAACEAERDAAFVAGLEKGEELARLKTDYSFEAASRIAAEIEKHKEKS